MPLLRAIKKAYPDAKVHFVVKKDFVPYLQRDVLVDKIFVYSTDATSLALNLLKENYSHIIDLEQSRTSLFLTRYLPQKYKSKTKVLNFPKGGLIQRLLTQKKAFQSETLSSDIIATFQKNLTIQNDGKGWGSNILPSDALKKEDLPTSHSLGYYCIAVDFETNNAAVRNLIESIPHPVILINKTNSVAITTLKQINDVQVYDAAEKFSDFEIIQILAVSKVNIIEANNKSSTLAALAKKPIIQIGEPKLPLSDLPEYTGKQHLANISLNDVGRQLAGLVRGFLK